MCLPIFFDRTEPSVKTGPLYPISPHAIAGRHQHVSPSPCVVGDVAGFVRIEGSGPAIVLAGGRDPINQHVMIEYPLLPCQGETQILLVPGMHIKDGRELGFFDICHTMSVDGSIRHHSRRMEIAGLEVSRFRALQETSPCFLSHR